MTPPGFPMSAGFPTFPDSWATLGLPADDVSTALTYPIAPGDTVAQVANAVNIPQWSLIMFGAELCQISLIVGNTITFGTAQHPASIEGRGLAGTTVAAHNVGVIGYLNVNAWYQWALASAIFAIEKYLTGLGRFPLSFAGQDLTGQVFTAPDETIGSALGTGALSVPSFKYELADYHNCILQGCIFTGRFAGANFKNTKLMGAMLVGVFVGCDFTNADMTGATLAGNFLGCTFKNTQMTGMIGHSMAQIEGSPGWGFNDVGPNFSGSYFVDGDMQDCILPDSDFRGATFLNTLLSGGQLQRSNFAGVTFQNCVMDNADFTGSLDGSTLPAGISGTGDTILTSCVFINSILAGVLFTNALMQNCYFRASSAHMAIFNGADLSGSVMNMNAPPDPLNFVGSNVTGVQFKERGPNPVLVAVIGADYTIGIGDIGRHLIFMGAGPWTMTLGVPPSSTWQVSVFNGSALAVTLDAGALMIDGVPGVITIAPATGLWLFTDGVNYFTQR